MLIKKVNINKFDGVYMLITYPITLPSTSWLQNLADWSGSLAKCKLQIYFYALLLNNMSTIIRN